MILLTVSGTRFGSSGRQADAGRKAVEARSTQKKLHLLGRQELCVPAAGVWPGLNGCVLLCPFGQDLPDGQKETFMPDAFLLGDLVD